MAEINATQFVNATQSLSQDMRALAASFQTFVRSQQTNSRAARNSQTPTRVGSSQTSNTSAVNQATKAQAASAKEAKRAASELKAFQKSLGDVASLNAQQIRLHNQAMDAKRAEIQSAARVRSLEDKRAKALANGSSQARINRLNQAIEGNQQKALAQSVIANSHAEALNVSVANMTKSVNLANTMLGMFSAALSTTVKTTVKQYRANEGLVEGTGSLIGAMASQQNDALRNLVNPEFYAKVTAENRQMLNALGGSSVGLKSFQKTIDDLTIQTGSYEQGLALATRMASDLANKGVKPTSQAMAAYQSDITRLRRQTGLSIEGAQALYNEVSSDAESISILRSAREDERAAILKSQRALIQQSIAAGMSAEQAKEAAKMLNQMVAAKPLDRLKQAAKVRAMGAAMGISGANEAADAIIAGKRATPEQMQAQNDFFQRMTNQVDASGRQSLGQEIFVSKMTEKMGLEQQVGKGSPFSTSLGQDTLKSAVNVDTAFVDASKDQTAQIAKSGADIVQAIMLLVTGQHWIGTTVLGIGALLTAYLARNKIAGAVGKAGDLLGGRGGRGGAGGGKGGKGKMGKILGLGGLGAGAAGLSYPDIDEAMLDIPEPNRGGPPGTEKPGSAGKAGEKAGGWLSKLGKFGKVAGKVAGKIPGIGTAIDVGMGLYDLSQGNRQKEMPTGLDMLSPMRWAMYAGDKVYSQFESPSSSSGSASEALKAAMPSMPDMAGMSKKMMSDPMKAISDISNKAAGDGNALLGDISSQLSFSAESVTQQLKATQQGNAVQMQLLEQLKTMNSSLDKLTKIGLMSESDKSDALSKLQLDSKFTSRYGTL